MIGKKVLVAAGEMVFLPKGVARTAIAESLAVCTAALFRAYDKNDAFVGHLALHRMPKDPDFKRKLKDYVARNCRDYTFKPKVVHTSPDTVGVYTENDAFLDRSDDQLARDCQDVLGVDAIEFMRMVEQGPEETSSTNKMEVEIAADGEEKVLKRQGWCNVM